MAGKKPANKKQKFEAAPLSDGRGSSLKLLIIGISALAFAVFMFNHRSQINNSVHNIADKYYKTQKADNDKKKPLPQGYKDQDRKAMEDLFNKHGN